MLIQIIRLSAPTMPATELVRTRLRRIDRRGAMTLFAKYEGLLLDPVYTGRAAAGMVDLIRKGFFKKDETVLP